MALRAMGFSPLSPSGRKPGYTSPHVLLMGNWFQMGGIDTLVHSAEVVKFKPFGNRAYQ